MSAVGFAFAAAPLTWWAVGPMGTQWADHQFGPYEFSPGILYTLGGLSVAVAAIAGLFAITPRLRRSTSPVSVWTALLLVLPGILLAWAWRVLTAGQTGPDIGGGLVLAVGVPLVVAAALTFAVVVESAQRGQRLERAGALVTSAILTAPVLYTIVAFVR